MFRGRMKTKRALIYFGFIIILVTSIFTIVSAQSSTDDWPMFHHGPSHTGYSNSPAPNTNQTAWNYNLGSSTLSSVAVVDEKVYAVNSYDGVIYCLGASEGDFKWKNTVNSVISSSPAVSAGKVYFGAHDGNVYCLNASNGDISWQYTTGDSVYYSSLVINGNNAYVGSDDFNVYCLDTLNGNLKWKYATNNYVRSSPAFVEGKVYIGSNDYNIYCLDASSGDLVWQYTTEGVVPSSPAVVEGKVYVCSDDNFTYCLDATDGSLIWNEATGICGLSSPAVSYGKVYVGSEDEYVYCLDASNGSRIWQFRTGGSLTSSPAVADGKVYIGSQPGNIYCLDAYNGDLLWQFATGSSVLSSPAIAHSKVFAMSLDGFVYAFADTPKASSTVWVPPTEKAVIATATTAVVVGAVSLIAAAVSNPVGTVIGKLGEKVSDLLSESVKKWLSDFASSKQTTYLEQKTSSAFLPTKPEALAYGVSLIVLTISFSYVKVSNFNLIWDVLPTVLMTAVIVEFVKTFALVTLARRLGVWTEHRLWYLGLAMFIVTTFVFGVPFSSPSRTLYYTPNSTKRREGLIASAAILITLGFAALFFLLFASGFTLIGGTGMAMCAIMAFLDAFPVLPMNGSEIFKHSKKLWAALFALTLVVYLFWLLLF